MAGLAEERRLLVARDARQRHRAAEERSVVAVDCRARARGSGSGAGATPSSSQSSASQASLWMSNSIVREAFE